MELNRAGADIRVIGLVRNIEKASLKFLRFSGKGLELIEQDMSKPLKSVLPPAEYIIHAASQASPKYYSTDPVGTIEANVIGCKTLLEHTLNHPCRSFLYVSSGEVYGQPVDRTEDISEKDYGYLDPATVRACYAESKRLSETMCLAWHHQYKVPAVIVRPFHTYGPGMDLDDGRVFADFVRNVVLKENITIKSDGGAKRPFCYIADATLGFFTLLLKGTPGEAYNLANPNSETSILQLAHLLANLYEGHNVGVEINTSNTNSTYLQSPIQRSCPAVSKIEDLGWTATTGLAAGFKRTIQHYIKEE